MTDKTKLLFTALEAMSEDVRTGRPVIAEGFDIKAAAALAIYFNIDIRNEDHILVVLSLLWAHLFFRGEPGAPHSYPIPLREMLTILYVRVSSDFEKSPAYVAGELVKSESRLASRNSKSVLQHIKRVIGNTTTDDFVGPERRRFRPILALLSKWIEHHTVTRRRRGKYA